MNGTSKAEKRSTKDGAEQVPAVSAAYKSILSSIGEDVTREGILKTPDRAAKALMFFTKGYYDSVEGKLNISILLATTK